MVRISERLRYDLLIPGFWAHRTARVPNVNPDVCAGSAEFRAFVDGGCGTKRRKPLNRAVVPRHCGTTRQNTDFPASYRDDTAMASPNDNEAPMRGVGLHGACIRDGLLRSAR